MLHNAAAMPAVETTMLAGEQTLINPPDGKLESRP